jgi:Suppressor of fused protein (SUFU)
MTAHPAFRVLEIAPGLKSALWNYVSVGACDLPAPNASRLEFLLCSKEPSERAVELVTMVAWYHSTEGLGVGHTMPIGEPWMPGATCDHFLVSLPYPYGPELEIVPGQAEHGHVLWLLPITKSEREYRATYGLEALETLFDSNEIEYWLPDRASVVCEGH